MPVVAVEASRSTRDFRVGVFLSLESIRLIVQNKINSTKNVQLAAMLLIRPQRLEEAAESSEGGTQVMNTFALIKSHYLMRRNLGFVDPPLSRLPSLLLRKKRDDPRLLHLLPVVPKVPRCHERPAPMARDPLLEALYAHANIPVDLWTP